MEIALLNDISIRIKGKSGAVIVNPSAKAIEANGFLYLDGVEKTPVNLPTDALVIVGPGEYEFGGIKVTGIRNSNGTVYRILVDRIELLIGSAKILERDYAKLKEHNIVLMYTTEAVDPSFVTSLATNVILLYGNEAQATMELMAKDSYRKESKYTMTYDKLPQEVEKILLA